MKTVFCWYFTIFLVRCQQKYQSFHHFEQFVIVKTDLKGVYQYFQQLTILHPVLYLLLSCNLDPVSQANYCFFFDIRASQLGNIWDFLKKFRRFLLIDKLDDTIIVESNGDAFYEILFQFHWKFPLQKPPFNPKRQLMKHIFRYVVTNIILNKFTQKHQSKRIYFVVLNVLR